MQSSTYYEHAQIQEIFSGRGGIQAQLPENSPDNNLFSPQLILQFYRGGPAAPLNVHFNVSEGVQHFPVVGARLFSGGGVQMLISIETHIT